MKKTSQSISGTSYYDDNVIASLNQIKSVLGEPDDIDHNNKYTYRWNMETENGDVFTLYDYKDNVHSGDQKIEWHIGAFDGETSSYALDEVNEAMGLYHGSSYAPTTPANDYSRSSSNDDDDTSSVLGTIATAMIADDIVSSFDDTPSYSEPDSSPDTEFGGGDFGGGGSSSDY